ncbi:hypothetical protein GCM10010172_07500 [Paractinoplanes ferrugineus]|uniref:Uncharacterized protein n=1 Tax=Paractinoplanes ferrugineus TaxID=113564 RepID=A0A919J9Y0_9ACTN|nr:hypothetical protein [Actinoplanes ferrugineus]GIE16853.1 hypothetical protein Afe05nite_86930 [Actinoplanes ferrugineus]
MTDDDRIARRLAHVRALDERNELVEERATEYATAEGSNAFSPYLPDDPTRQPERENYRARARRSLGLACCEQYGIGDHDPVEHGGA